MRGEVRGWHHRLLGRKRDRPVWRSTSLHQRSDRRGRRAGGDQRNDHGYRVAADLPAGMSSGTLPAGISFGPMTHTLSGVPTEAGTFTGTFRAGNEIFSDANQSFTIRVDLSAPTTTDDVPATVFRARFAVTLIADRLRRSRGRQDLLHDRRLAGRSDHGLRRLQPRPRSEAGPRRRREDQVLLDRHRRQRRGGANLGDCTGRPERRDDHLRRPRDCLRRPVR